MALEPDFRLDGPHDPALTQAAADQIAERVKFLVYATLGGAPGLGDPADADRLISALYTATGRMPQLFDQVTRFANRLAATGRLRDDENRSANGQVARASYHLDEARGHAAKLTGALQAAQNVFSALSVTEDGDD